MSAPASLTIIAPDLLFLDFQQREPEVGVSYPISDVYKFGECIHPLSVFGDFLRRTNSPSLLTLTSLILCDWIHHFHDVFLEEVFQFGPDLVEAAGLDFTSVVPRTRSII